MNLVKFFATAAITAMALTGCSQNDEPADNTGTGKTVTIKLASTVVSRAADKTQVPSGYKTPINDVTLYFLDGNDRVVSPVDYMTGAEITNGKTFSGISASAVKVYVVANTTNSADGSALFSDLNNIHLNKPKSDIEQMAAAISTQMNNSGIGIDNNVLSGEASFTPSGTTEFETSVTLSPAVCRFEITSITANQSSVNKVTQFDLTGIFMNTYYTDFTIGGGFNGSYYGVSATPADLSNVIPVMKDEISNKTGFLTYSATAGKAWAYMMPVGNTPPIIVFRLSNVQINGADALPTTKYVSVKNFRNANTNELITPKRGEVYVVRNIVFTPEDITTNPNEGDINVTVSVDVKNWTIVSAEPLL